MLGLCIHLIIHQDITNYHSFSAGAQPPHEGVRERRAVDGDEEEQEALEEERRQGEEPQQLRVR